MEEITLRISEYTNKISNFKNYTDELCKEYLIILKDLKSFLEEKKAVIENEKLKNRILSCLKETKIELNDRFDPYFFTIHDQKKQTEFTYSKTIILNSLKRIMKSI